MHQQIVIHYEALLFIKKAGNAVSDKRNTWKEMRCPQKVISGTTIDSFAHENSCQTQKTCFQH